MYHQGKLSPRQSHTESIGYGHESWNEEGNESELVEMEASQTELQQVTEEVSYF